MAVASAAPQHLSGGMVLRTTRVVLACAHLNHDVGNNDPANLRALCHRCHILHDRDEHLRQRWFTYRLRWAMGNLFLGLSRSALDTYASPRGSTV